MDYLAVVGPSAGGQTLTNHFERGKLTEASGCVFDLESSSDQNDALFAAG